MFTYYTLIDKSANLYYCSGHNPCTGEFEFYDSENNKDWNKNTIQFQGRDCYGSSIYKIATQCQGEITLTVFSERPDLLLTYKQPSVSANLFANNRVDLLLVVIRPDSLPPSLRPMDEQLASDSQNPDETLREKAVKKEASRYCSPKSKNISMQILGGFMAALGCSAVALAFTVLNTATLGGVGIAALILGIGFFAVGTYRNCQTSPDALDFSNERLLT